MDQSAMVSHEAAQAVSEDIASQQAVLPQHPDNPDTLLTAQQLAHVLTLSIRTLENWRLSGDGPPFCRAGGRRVLYRWGSVCDWIGKQEVNSTSEEQAA